VILAGTIAALAAGAASLPAAVRAADEGEPYANIVNLPAPEWSVGDWINSPPLSLEKLRGRVVLIRWWTGPGCPFCTPSAPRLNALHRRYKEQGLAVIGFYHQKSGEPVRAKEVARLAKKLGIEFPVAIDHGWRTLRRYWLDRAPKEAWTSVSFLIDQEGIIRYVHPGGTITGEDAGRIEKESSALLQTRRRTR